MRVNQLRNTLDIEERDWDFFMPAMLRMYLFQSKGIEPKEVIFPKFKSIKYGDVEVSVKWIDPESSEAKEIKVDGSNIPQTDEILEVKGIDEELPLPTVKEATLPKVVPEEKIEEVKLRPPVRSNNTVSDRSQGHIGKDRTPPIAPDRVAKTPASVVPPGTPLGGSLRDPNDLAKVASDLKQEPDIKDEDENETIK